MLTGGLFHDFSELAGEVVPVTKATIQSDIRDGAVGVA